MSDLSKVAVNGTVFEMRILDIKEFIEQLLRSGMKPAQVSYEAYKYALALLEFYNLENRTAMESAAVMLEEATKRAGIHTTQLKRYE